MSGVVVRAEVEGRAGISLRVHRGRVEEVGADLVPAIGEWVIDARGGAVIPGLHDHHLHLRAIIAARRSVHLDPDAVIAAGGLSAALSNAARQIPNGIELRAIGAYGLEFADLDRWVLDKVCGDRPVRVQHRSGALWLLNSAAISAYGIAGWSEGGVERDADGVPTGRLFRLDDRLRAIRDPQTDAEWAALSDEALRMGLVGFTDATPDRDDDDHADLLRLVDQGHIKQRLFLMTPEHRLGTVKIVLDDPSLPTGPELAAQIDALHESGSRVAVHCVTASQLAVALAAWSETGLAFGDRVEHAGVVPPGFAEQLAYLQLTVVTQPGFLFARGDDYRRDVEPGEQPWLYPCRSLLDAGVEVAGSSDAPFGPLDPWLAMRAAIDRRSSDGHLLNGDERVDPMTALGLYLGAPEQPGTPRTIAPGTAAQLCILDAPLAEVLAEPDSAHVRAVILDEEVSEWTP